MQYINERCLPVLRDQKRSKVHVTIGWEIQSSNYFTSFWWLQVLKWLFEICSMEVNKFLWGWLELESSWVGSQSAEWFQTNSSTSLNFSFFIRKTVIVSTSYMYMMNTSKSLLWHHSVLQDTDYRQFSWYKPCSTNGWVDTSLTDIASLDNIKVSKSSF